MNITSGHQPSGSLSLTLYPLLVGMSALGALAHDALGLAGALIVMLLVLPVLTALVTLVWVSRGDSSDLVRLLALQSACAVGLLVPVLALPGALLGWVGVSLLTFGAPFALRRT